MPTYDVSLSDLAKQLNAVDQPDCFRESNPRYCLNLVQASSKWAAHNGKGVGYPTFVIENGHMKVMTGKWTERRGGNPHNTFEDLPVKDLVRFGLDPSDMSSDGVLKWARATNCLADSGIVDDGACAIMTGETSPTARGSHALHTMQQPRDYCYQAQYAEMPPGALERFDADFKNLTPRFDVWTRAVFKYTRSIVTDLGDLDWGFPNYQVSPQGAHGIYLVMKATLELHH